MSKDKQLIVFSPLYAEMLTDNLVTTLRELRTEWFLIRDTLCVQRNAEFLDTINDLRSRIYELRVLVNDNKEAITAQLN